MSQISHISAAEFTEEIKENGQPTLVDFYADWCGPCKVIAPMLEEISSAYSGKMKFCKLDVDANRDIAVKYNIRGIPTLLIFVNGQVKDTLVGSVGKDALTQFIEKNL